MSYIVKVNNMYFRCYYNGFILFTKIKNEAYKYEDIEYAKETAEDVDGIIEEDE